jgi:hypothetical protein
MKRYFFDVVSDAGSSFDYRGREFSACEKAIEFAKILALDLGIMQEGDMEGSRVVVRDPAGQNYFSMQVGNFAAAC